MKDANHSLKENLRLLETLYFHSPVKKEEALLLGGGRSFAQNYRIDHEGKSYLARFMSSHQELESRKKECLISNHVGQLGIGPKVYYQNPKEGILLTDFIQGNTAKYDDIMKDPRRRGIIKQLRKLHQSAKKSLPTSETITIQIKYTLNFYHLDFLHSQLKKLELSEPLKALSHYEENHETHALIHGDFNPNNILIHQNKIYIIDWTNAGIGDPFADISWLALFYSPSSHRELLNNYFDNIDSLIWAQFIAYYCLRLFLRAIWAISQAKILAEKDFEKKFNEILNSQKAMEPDRLMLKLVNREITLDNFNDLLFFSTTILKWLSAFTKKEGFISTIKELIHDV